MAPDYDVPYSSRTADTCVREAKRCPASPSSRCLNPAARLDRAELPRLPQARVERRKAEPLCALPPSRLHEADGQARTSFPSHRIIGPVGVHPWLACSRKHGTARDEGGRAVGVPRSLKRPRCGQGGLGFHLREGGPGAAPPCWNRVATLLGARGTKLGQGSCTPRNAMLCPGAWESQ